MCVTNYVNRETIESRIDCFKECNDDDDDDDDNVH